MTDESSSSHNPIITLVVITLSIVALHLSVINTHTEEKVTHQRVIIDEEGNVQPIENYSLFIDSGKTINQPHKVKILKTKPEAKLKPVKDLNTDSLFYAELMRQSPEYGSPVKKTIIRYYVKDKDADKVYGLEKYGFYIHERPSPLRASDQSNAMYVGDSVSNADVLLVGYTLIRAGLEIKTISFSRAHAGWKSNSIEIGTDTTATDLPPLTLSDLKQDWGNM
ncbi:MULTISPECIES: hypothetical protein [Reichenbachiella]|uniref:Uncharacterized protein n=1 Tax=Reichenbachiella agariperforans TaxID=156994 RepID=A0A1M6TTY6_REIAG|nr:MULTISPECIES: hypothetical protein [Reichenbachiella]MBU2915578.1 hypothetical protein [Reichenbachiella agariperforans]RJE71360.1 hypothetical protein BGP76_04475 [Reichenbachiella sp. MSK19-1]SHK60485.1 hypothetical protein SAMN04488028_106186 [Reichenbachiella agariperforans]